MASGEAGHLGHRRVTLRPLLSLTVGRTSSAREDEYPDSCLGSQEPVWRPNRLSAAPIERKVGESRSGASGGASVEHEHLPVVTAPGQPWVGVPKKTWPSAM